MICGNKIITYRNFDNIFETNFEIICQRCCKNKPPQYLFRVIPIVEGLIYNYYLFDDEKIEPIFYQQHLRKYYFMSLKTKNTIIYVDQLTEDTINLLNYIQFGDLFLISIN